MFYVIPTVPENPPLNPVGMATNSRTIQFSWGIPPGRHNGIIREYRVNAMELQTGRAFQRTASTTSILITSLQPSYTYRLSVSAYTISEGPYSPALNVTTPEDGQSFNLSYSSMLNSSCRSMYFHQHDFRYVKLLLSIPIFNSFTYLLCHYLQCSCLCSSWSYHIISFCNFSQFIC